MDETERIAAVIKQSLSKSDPGAWIDGPLTETKIDGRFDLLAVARAATVAQWQIIHTAPSDEEILMWSPVLKHQIGYRPSASDLDRKYWGSSDWAAADGNIYPPTHWMPLQVGPK